MHVMVGAPGGMIMILFTINNDQAVQVKVKGVRNLYYLQSMVTRIQKFRNNVFRNSYDWREQPQGNANDNIYNQCLFNNFDKHKMLILCFNPDYHTQWIHFTF